MVKLEQTVKSREVLMEFAKFCKANPSLRFWQALTAFSGYDKVGWYDSEKREFHDKYYAKGK